MNSRTALGAFGWSPAGGGRRRGAWALWRAASFLAALLCLLLAARPAAAQFGPGRGGGMPGGPPTKQSAPKKDPNVPETHAASGSGDDTIPKTTTGEPTLPQDPLAVSDAVRKRIGSTATGPGADQAVEPPGKHEITLVPPYFQDKNGPYRLRTVFPVWFERTLPKDRASVFAGIYYQRRSPEITADVVFPFYWNYREGKDHTLVVAPFARHTSPTATDTMVAPFVFTGTRPDGGYVNIPPLLTFLKHDKYGGRSIIGPGFCFWKGGATCDPNTADDIDFGVAPLYFAGKNERGRYELTVPLLHYYGYRELDRSWLNVWGPVISAHYPERDAFHVAPFFFRVWGKNEDHVTIPPLIFHYGYKGDSNLLVTPAFLLGHGEHGESTFVTWGYARYRGRTELDMVTPFYWRYADPDASLERRLLFPFYYSSESPRESNFALFPFYGHFNRYSLSETTYVTPFFRHTQALTGWETDILPFAFFGRDREHSHTVVAPFFWDFVTPESRATVAFPIYWRFADQRSVTQVALNTLYHEKKLRDGLDWEFHFFPLFSYGETPNGHWWNLLYGLAGYTRSGAETKMRLFWVPLELSQDRP